MGSTHGPSGTLVGLGGIVAAQQLLPVAPVVAVFWTAGATAGALLPDADHHASSTSKLWGPATQVPARWLGRLAGGHRAGTHDVSKGAPIFFAVAFTVGLLGPASATRTGSPWALAAGRVGGMLVVALLTGLLLLGVAPVLDWLLDLAEQLTATRLPALARGIVDWPSNLVLSWFVAFTLDSVAPGGLPLAGVAAAAAGVAVGALVAIGQDGCTASGIPFRGRTIHLLPEGWRVTTNKAFERLFIRPVVLAGVAALALLLAAG